MMVLLKKKSSVYIPSARVSVDPDKSFSLRTNNLPESGMGFKYTNTFLTSPRHAPSPSRKTRYNNLRGILLMILGTNNVSCFLFEME